MLLHLAHYPDKESISLQFLHAACLAETQQIQILPIHPGFFRCEIRNDGHYDGRFDFVRSMHIEWSGVDNFSWNKFYLGAL